MTATIPQLQQLDRKTKLVTRHNPMGLVRNNRNCAPCSVPVFVQAGLGATWIDMDLDAAVGFPVRTKHSGIVASIALGAELFRVDRLRVAPTVNWVGQLFGRQPANFRRTERNAYLMLSLGLRWR